MGILSKIFGESPITDVLDILKTQHDEVDALIAKLEAGEGNRRALFTELADRLAAHATVEEKLFYPFVMSKDTNVLLHESVEEHLAMKRTLADMLTMQLDSTTFMAKLSVLKEQVRHHARDEEEGELFPKVKDLLSADERAGLGNEVLAMFVDLMEKNPSRNVPGETLTAAPLPAVR